MLEVEDGGQPGGSGGPVGVVAQFADLGAVQAAVQPHPDPSAAADIGGRKNLPGSAATSSCWAPGGPAHHRWGKSLSWWPWAHSVTKALLPRTNQVGAPWLSRSVTSGSARQIVRTARLDRLSQGLRLPEAWVRTLSRKGLPEPHGDQLLH
jgi:hypothetical protein